MDLKENEDFSFDDIDESKELFRYSAKLVDNIYAHDSDFNNHQIEYWNMHTYTNKIIEKNKIPVFNKLYMLSK